MRQEMNTVQRIIKNSGASLVSRILGPLGSFLIVLLIARIFGPNELGKYSTALAVLYIFEGVACLGFPYIITREVAQNKRLAGNYFINACFIGISFSVFIVMAMVLVGYFLIEDVETTRAINILSIGLIPYSVCVSCHSVCSAFEKQEYNAYSLFIGTVFKVCFGSYVVIEGYGLVGLMTVFLGSNFFILLVALYTTFKVLRNQNITIGTLNFLFCKDLMLKTWLFALIYFLLSIRLNVDIVVLNRIMGIQDVGIYSAAFKIYYILTHVIVSYMMAIQPLIFRLFRESKEKFKFLCIESVRILYLIIFPSIAGMLVIGENVLRIVYGDSFVTGTNALQCLVCSLLFLGVNQIFANALIASNRQSVNLRANIIAMITSVFTNILLVQYLGIIGAALASVLSALASMLYQWYFVRKHLFCVPFLNFAVKPLLASLIMWILISFINKFNLILTIFFGAIIYLISLYFLKAISPNDLSLLRSLIRRWN